MTVAPADPRVTAVVPALPGRRVDHGSFAVAVRLQGRSALAHAVSAVAELGVDVVVATSPSGVEAVCRTLADDGLAGSAVVEQVDDFGQLLQLSWSRRGTADLVLIHEPRCPLVPSAFLREVLEATRAEPAAVHVAVRPVTDTVKSLVDNMVQATIDRSRLHLLSSPVVLSRQVLQRLQTDTAAGQCADVTDLLVACRSARVSVRWIAAPPTGRRIGDLDSAVLLECLTEVHAAGTR